MSDIERRKIEQKLNELCKKDSNGNITINKEDILKNFTESEISIVVQIMTKKGYILSSDIVTKSDRSPLVRDHDYGKFESYDIQSMDIPEIAKVEYDKDGHIIFENFDELDRFLEEVFIPENVVMMKKRKSEDPEKNLYPFIQYYKIVKLRLSDIEIKHVLEYLNKQGINVRGINSSVDQDFGNYDYYRTYKNAVLPEPLSSEEILEKIVIYNATKDPVIREQILLGSLRLVPWIAYKYGIMYDIDSKLLESYGYEGLIVSLDKFDINYGCKFSTFAISYIRGYIKYGVEEIITNYLHRSSWNSDYLRCKKIVEEAKGVRLIDNPDLAVDVTKLMIRDGSISSVSYKSNIRRIRLICSESIDELFQLDELPKDERFYDDKVDEVEQSEYSGEPLIEESDFFGEQLDNKFLLDVLNNALSTLTPREEKVIRLRFGLEDGRTRSLDEVAEIFNVTPERIRQIEAKSLRKLRHPSRSLMLRDFVDERQTRIGHK